MRHCGSPKDLDVTPLGSPLDRSTLAATDFEPGCCSSRVLSFRRVRSPRGFCAHYRASVCTRTTTAAAMRLDFDVDVGKTKRSVLVASGSASFLPEKPTEPRPSASRGSLSYRPGGGTVNACPSQARSHVRRMAQVAPKPSLVAGVHHSWRSAP
jgi:hypothetical protein